MRLFTASAFLLIALGGLVSGCSSTTEPPATAAISRPGPGTAYTYHVVSQDEAGSTIADSTASYVIADTGMTYAGQSSVVQVVGNGNDSVVYVNTPLGLMIHRARIEIFNGVALPELWISIDTTSTQTQSLYLSNDTVQYGGTDLYFASHAEMIPLSDTTVTIDGKPYAAIRWKTVSTVTVTVAFNGSATTTVVESVRAFAPSIGFFVADQTIVRGATAQSPVQNGTESSTLMSFVKK